MAIKMTKSQKTTPPSYTLGEELISSISHGFGAAFGIAALVLCIIKSVIAGDAWMVVSSCIYGGTLIILYSMSTIYHALAKNKAKKVFRILDHCSIFLLIAGTYTPYTLVAIRGPVGWVLFGIIWASAVVGIALNAISVQKFKIFSMICYVASGWAVIAAARPMAAAIPLRGIILLLLGGVAYSIGAVLYTIGKKIKYMHSIWHFFVLAGSILHFFSIFLYVIK